MSRDSQSVKAAIGTKTAGPSRLADELNRRVVIEGIRPRIDDGRFPIKRTPGEPVDVAADIFADGHYVVAAVLRSRQVSTDSPGWSESAMSLVAPGTDEWSGRFVVDEIGWHEYQIVAWADRF